MRILVFDKLQIILQFLLIDSKRVLVANRVNGFDRIFKCAAIDDHDS